MKNYDVIIIGGGLAGIKAYINLKKNGLNALIIEKSSYLGGRAFSFKDPLTGNFIDNGQHVIVGACKEYLNLLKETNNSGNLLQIKNYQVPVIKNNKVSMLGSKFFGGSLGLFISLVMYKHLNIKEKVSLIRLLLKIKYINLNTNREKKFKIWLKKNNQTDTTIKFFWDIFLKPALNEKIETIETKPALFVIKETFFSKNPQIFGLPKVNLSTFWDNFEKSNSKNILKKTIVKKINIYKDQIKNIVLNNGEELTANNYIFATQYSSIQKIFKDSNIKGNFKNKLETSPILGIHFWFKDKVTDDRYIASVDSEIQWIFNTSKNHNNNENHMVISQSASEKWMKMDKSEIKKIFLKELNLIYPKANQENLKKFSIVKQRDATFLCNEKNELIRNSIPLDLKNIYYSGDWRNTSWPSTMESAVISGKDVSNIILESVKR
ncbi:MAG: FAD-dependent oxidoreductase [Chloroflexota bacterium]|nr:FAD-dependent oxidoreductase [Chloroflexota bacterium]